MTDKAPKIPTQFINLQSDFGFKRAYGTKEFQKNVIQLLEAALGEDIDIKRIVPHYPVAGSGPELVAYHDKEVLPQEMDGKRIVYDVYFTMKVGKGASMFKPYHLTKENRDEDVEHHFILEMQNVYTPPFEDRMTYYVSEMISSQGKTGWNYDLDPVVLIAITDFDFPYLSKQMVQEFELREKNTGESLTKKLRMLFFSLKQVPKEWHECKSKLEKILFLIKNIDKMDKNSIAYKEGGYEDLFDSAESVNVVGEDMVLYSQSLAALREVQAGLDFRYEEGVQLGIQKGREEGREEGMRLGIEKGIEKERTEIVRKMKKAGMDLGSISEITGISPEIINNL